MKKSETKVENLFNASIPEEIIKKAREKKVSISKYASLKRVSFKLNKNFNFKDKRNKRKAAEFLAKAIDYWGERGVSFFCGNNDLFIWKNEKRKINRKNADNWNFSYKTPSSCGSCEMAQKILDLIFSNRSIFNKLPFVRFHGDRQYSFKYKYLRLYAEKGEEFTLKEMENDKKIKAKLLLLKEKEEEKKRREEQMKKLKTSFSNIDSLNKALIEQILDYADNKSLRIVNNNLALVITGRSSYGSVGCIAYYDQIRFFYKDKSDLQEKQTRNNSGYWTDANIFNQINDVVVKEEDNLIKIKVIVSNNGRDPKSFFQEFKDSLVETKKLSLKEQEDFFKLANEQMEQKMLELEKSWEFKPQYFSNLIGEYTNYKRPQFNYRKILTEHGIAIFIIEEQIDGGAGKGAQMRVNLYKFVKGMKTAEVIDEDHAYNTDRPAILTIVSFNASSLVYTITNQSIRKVHNF